MSLDPEKRNAILIATGIFIVGVVYALYETYFRPADIEWKELPLTPTQHISSSQVTTPVESKFILIQLSGAVVRPGVYRMSDTMRVMDVIEEAGGVTGEADMSDLNLTRRLTDQMTLYIPYKKTSNDATVSESSTPTNDVSPSGKVNINTADAQTLMTLHGIGKSIAERIVSYRSEHGVFSSVNDLTKVKGVGVKLLEKNKDNICF